MNVDEDKNRPFVTTGEIVTLAKVHPNTVHMWVATGKIIPKDKIGSSFLYDRTDVVDFLNQRAAKIARRIAKKSATSPSFSSGTSS
jgi:hypothetical protein